MRSTQRDTPSSVIGRASALLAAFRAEEDTVGVSELARRTGLAKSTVSRLVAEMAAEHLLERSGTSVRLGVRLFELGERAARPRDLRRAAREHLADLNRATAQTVHLAVLEGAEVVYLQILRGPHGPPLPSRVGGRMPAHATGVGKALLAFADPALVEEVLGAGLRAVGPRTITDAGVLRTELARVRASHLAYEREESGSGVACAASPVLRHGRAVAAVSISGWSGHLDVRRVAPAVKVAALGVARRVSTAR